MYKFELLAWLLNFQMVHFIWPFIKLFVFIAYYMSFLLYKAFEITLDILYYITHNQSYNNYHSSISTTSNPVFQSDYIKHKIQQFKQFGYNFEEYITYTPDEYALKCYRLFKDPNPNYNPIMMQHGLLDCSWSWFVNIEQEKCLPFILADKGYDIWLTNNRGNSYSMLADKKQPNPVDMNYYDYCLDDIVDHDVTTNIDFILSKTKKQQVIYIGHSQGTTQLFLKLSVDMKIQKKIQYFIGLGSALTTEYQDSTLMHWLKTYYFFELWLWMKLPTFFLFKNLETHRMIGGLVYLFPKLVEKSWFILIKEICGYTQVNKIDLKKFGEMVAVEPGGSSTRNLIQWMQFFRKGLPCKFDYGTDMNHQIYGQREAPHYPIENLKNFSIKKYLFFGTRDVLTHPRDIENLKELMPSSDIRYLEDYHHLDYLWSNNAWQLLYPQIIEIVKDNEI